MRWEIILLRLRQAVCRHKWDRLGTEWLAMHGWRNLVECSKCTKRRYFH